MPNSITFRDITDDDLDLLHRIYGSTREDELALVDWNDEQKAEFVAMQFHAQHTFYQREFCDAQYLIILQGDQPVGRLYVDRREQEHRIIDIALLTQYRRQGIGARIMQDLLDEAAAVGKPVTIHVERNNPAMHLYDRLGFVKIEDQDVYWLMKWEPKSDA